MAAPGRVVLWPAAAGLPCRRRRGWDHTSIPRPGVGCLPRWEGSSRGCWPCSRRETEAGQHGSGSKFDEVLTPTTRVAAPHPGQEHHRLERHSPTATTPSTGVAPVESSGVGRGRRHQTTDLAVGGSNPSRRAVTVAPRRRACMAKIGPDAVVGRSVLADVLVPDLGMLVDEPFHEVDAFTRVDHRDLDAGRPEPVDSAAEVLVLSDDDPWDAELPDQAAAVPAGGQGRHHGRAAVTVLPASLPEGWPAAQ